MKHAPIVLFHKVCVCTIQADRDCMEIACRSWVNNSRQQPDVRTRMITVKFNENAGLRSSKLHVQKYEKCKIRFYTYNGTKTFLISFL